MLQRGLSIDSVDRPFHPSEWVDVNLEVPCSPRDSVVLTRLSALTPELLQQRASSPSSNCKSTFFNIYKSDFPTSRSLM